MPKLRQKLVLASIFAILVVLLLVTLGVPAMADTSTESTQVTPTAVLPHPTITSVSPNQGSQGQTIASVTIQGTNFTGVTKVSFGRNITVSSFTVISDTEITASITIGNRAPVGSRIVTVSGPSGRGALRAGFTVLTNRPTITSVSPNQSSQGQTIANVTIQGTNFTGVTKVSFGRNITVNSFTVVSDTQITANITIGYHAPVGSRIVTVTSPSGRGILRAGFTVLTDRPEITGVNPNQSSQGQALTGVTIQGNNFTGVTKVSFGRNITVNSFTVVSDTQITANITIGDHAPVGSRIVTVTSPSGRGILRAGFIVTKSETTPAS